jgi:hypothetical protein
LQGGGLGGAGGGIVPFGFLQDVGILGAGKHQMTTYSKSHESAAIVTSASEARGREVAYQVGGITFVMRSANDLPLILDVGLQDFAVAGRECDVHIDVQWTESIENPQQAPLFQSGGLWALYGEPDGYRFNFSTTFLGDTPYKSAWFDPEFKTGKVKLSLRYFDPARPVYPLEYPLDELLMIHRLSRGEGVEMHAVGIQDEQGRGHLFLGHSGAGKSTTARLWSARPGVRILSDDRIILRVQQGRVWMYGTPWHGDAGIASPHSALLDHVYLLEHGERNEREELAPGKAAAELFARTFVPRHCAEGLQFALSFLDRVAHAVPCSHFRFVPNESAVEAIACAAA